MLATVTNNARDDLINSSFRRMPESREINSWTPAFAGVTTYSGFPWRRVHFAEKQALDNRMEQLDSGMHRNDEIRDFYPRIF